ncbi:MAG: hypothetical protein EXR82_00530 [Gammaproteobacteria bacterium]|nr:hypothetical protein [Gammaproteobacteria bacterium]
MRTAMGVERIGSAELKDLVAGGSTLDLVFPVASLARLAALSPSAGHETSLRASLTFQSGSAGHLQVDSQVQPQVQLRVAGAVDLACQRCLQPLVLPVAIEVLLTMVRSEEKAAELVDAFDTVLLEDGELAPAQVVEDEVLAWLPLAPKHSDETSCGRDAGLISGEMHRPLAGLADLLGRGDRQGDG